MRDLISLLVIILEGILAAILLAWLMTFGWRGCAISIWYAAGTILWLSFVLNGNEHIYTQIIGDYPKEDCVRPQIFKFLFKKLEKISDKGIPKEMVFSELLKFIVFWIYSIMAIIVLFYNGKIATIMGFMYILLIGGINVICGFIMLIKKFFSRYKKLNRHNFKYFLGAPDNPEPKKIGTCRIMWTFKKGKKIFAIVNMVETGELKENVPMIGNPKPNGDGFYNMYEICHVYYIE